MSVRPKKRLGQHFLTDEAVVRAIATAVGDPPGGLVEIGPGEGALTGALLARHPAMVALEVDPEAVAHLRRRFPALDVRETDVLEADWAALAGEGRGATSEESGRALEADRPSPLAPRSSSLTVVGNLPYYITSPILLSLLAAREHVARAVVMVQKEVADRLVAPPGSKVYGTVSVYLALTSRATLLLDVPRHAFRPPPAVESAVVVVEFDGRSPVAPFRDVRRVVRAAFGQRRKMLRNSLGPIAAETGRALPEWAATRRPEAVSPDDFDALARHFFGEASV